MPKVSVIIPVYNVEKYLSECLDSVINQTLKDIEIICIDDSSTDNSLSILEKYAKKDKRIKVIKQKNLGAGVARNRGLEVAKGEYIGFVDSDDYVDLDFFKKLYNKSKINKYDFIKGDLKQLYQKKQKIKFTNTNLKIAKASKITKIPYKNLASSWLSIIYRKDLIDKYNIKFANIRWLEDVTFLYKFVSIANNFVLVNDAYYTYRLRENSTSHKILSEKELIAQINSKLNSRLDTLDFFNKNINNKDKYDRLFFSTIYKGLEHSWESFFCCNNVNIVKHAIDKSIDILSKYKYPDSKLIRYRFYDILLSKDIDKLKKYFYTKNLKFVEYIFSIKNSSDAKHKIITLFGLKIKIKRRSKNA